jgi:hypothetical protein
MPSSSKAAASSAVVRPRMPRSGRSPWCVLQPQQTAQGFAVGEQPVARPGQQLVQAGDEHVKKFAFVELSLTSHQIASEKDVDDLGGIRNHGVHGAGVSPFASAVAGFFLQLALGAGQQVFARIELARRKLNQSAGARDSATGARPPAAVGQLGHHHHGARVAHVLARSFAAIGQANAVAKGVQETAAQQLLAVQRVLLEVDQGLRQLTHAHAGASALEQVAVHKARKGQGHKKRARDGIELPALWCVLAYGFFQ